MSMTPAFSPGPWITHGAFVGSVRRWIFEDLYEQCSFHIAEKMPSSVKVGARPISLRSRAYSSGLSPCAATSAAVTLGSAAAGAARLAGSLFAGLATRFLGARSGVRLVGFFAAALALAVALRAFTFALVTVFLG